MQQLVILVQTLVVYAGFLMYIFQIFRDSAAWLSAGFTLNIVEAPKGILFIDQTLMAQVVIVVVNHG